MGAPRYSKAKRNAAEVAREKRRMDRLTVNQKMLATGLLFDLLIYMYAAALPAGERVAAGIQPAVSMLITVIYLVLLQFDVSVYKL